jgi:hypothetical protein
MINTKPRHGKYLSPEEYEVVSQRVSKGAKILSGKFGDPAYDEKWELYNMLSVQMLQYEIEHGILEEEMEAWKNKQHRLL